MDESPSDEIDEKELEKIIVKDNNKYIKKLELGKMIYEMVGEGVVPVLPQHMNLEEKNKKILEMLEM